MPNTREQNEAEISDLHQKLEGISEAFNTRRINDDGDYVLSESAALQILVLLGE